MKIFTIMLFVCVCVLVFAVVWDSLERKDRIEGLDKRLSSIEEALVETDAKIDSLLDKTTISYGYSWSDVVYSSDGALVVRENGDAISTNDAVIKIMNYLGLDFKKTPYIPESTEIVKKK